MKNKLKRKISKQDSEKNIVLNIKYSRRTRIKINNGFLVGIESQPNVLSKTINRRFQIYNSLQKESQVKFQGQFQGFEIEIEIEIRINKSPTSGTYIDLISPSWLLPIMFTNTQNKVLVKATAAKENNSKSETKLNQNEQRWNKLGAIGFNQ